MVADINWQISGFDSLHKKLPDLVFSQWSFGVPGLTSWFTTVVNSQVEWRMLLSHLIWSMAGKRFRHLNGTTLIVGCLDRRIKSSLMLAVAVSWIPVLLSISTPRCQFPGLFQCLLILIISIRHVLWIQNERKEPTKRAFGELLVLGRKIGRFQKGLLLPSSTL